eukprot:GILK01015218.1.p1 GENE.GILK01015218.1~~GILK01015218.1.p1  ORF type:complete len:441 (-),score=79.91 GILK01015218.1:125-1447(-)
MRIGYPCQNLSLGLTTGHTFRLASYSAERLHETARENLCHLRKMLEFNISKKIPFLRIGSQMVPFASHAVCDVPWWDTLKAEFSQIGSYIKENKLRVSMHPDQFTLLNALNSDITRRSVEELRYHCRLLDAMGLDETCKVQIHVGGVYGDKVSAKARFVEVYKTLPAMIKKRLVIENDDRLFTLRDCLDIHKETRIPVLFDNLHHECLNEGEPMRDALVSALKTWSSQDGVPMIDYSSQQPNARKGNHAATLNPDHFKQFVDLVGDLEFDAMLEIKDKERSVLKAQAIMSSNGALLKQLSTDDLTVIVTEDVKHLSMIKVKKRRSAAADVIRDQVVSEPAVESSLEVELSSKKEAKKGKRKTNMEPSEKEAKPTTKAGIKPAKRRQLETSDVSAAKLEHKRKRAKVTVVSDVNGAVEVFSDEPRKPTRASRQQRTALSAP